MKKSEYEQVQLDITYLEAPDIITTSNQNSQIGETNTDSSGWTTPKKWT